MGGLLMAETPRHVHWWSVEEGASCGCCTGCTDARSMVVHPEHEGAACATCGHRNAMPESGDDQVKDQVKDEPIKELLSRSFTKRQIRVKARRLVTPGSDVDDSTFEVRLYSGDRMRLIRSDVDALIELLQRAREWHDRVGLPLFEDRPITPKRFEEIIGDVERRPDA